jgi:signal peptidase I
MITRALGRALGLVGALAVAVAIAVYVLNPLGTRSLDPRLRVLGFNTYTVPTHGMEPTLQYHEVFNVSAWSYRNTAPKPGDVIVFRYPKDPSVLYVKRVIAAGGSTIEIVDGVTIIDGQPIQEPYLGGSVPRRDFSRTMARVRVPPQNFFVMGDNRDDSYDSRMFGAVSRDQIIGKWTKN